METLYIGFFVVAYWKRWKALKTEPQSVQNVRNELQQIDLTCTISLENQITLVVLLK